MNRSATIDYNYAARFVVRPFLDQILFGALTKDHDDSAFPAVGPLHFTVQKSHVGPQPLLVWIILNYSA